MLVDHSTRGKSTKGADVYCLFVNTLLCSYFTGDKAAKTIIEKGFQLIYRAVDKVDSILNKKYKIVLNGSLADLYEEFLPNDRLISSPSHVKKAELLADIAKDPSLQIDMT